MPRPYEGHPAVRRLVPGEAEMRRRSIRLPDYSYSQPGAYAITICTHHREEFFGQAAGGEMRLNAQGRIVEDCWAQIPTHFPQVGLDAFVVMPNHVHGIILVHQSEHHLAGRPGAARVQVSREAVVPSLPTIAASFKSAATRRINVIRGAPGAPVWQRGYYERLIRNERQLNALRRYIVENPLKWDLDRENRNSVRIHNLHPDNTTTS